MERNVSHKPPKRGLLSNPLLVAIPILIALFFTRSPYMMTATTPSRGKPWADAPITLITTPPYETKEVCGAPLFRCIPQL
jgi:hypothetical protein